MFNKIKLPYAYDALEPFIDKETVNIHYNKHLQTYVNNLNMLLEGYDKFVNGKSLDQILSNLDEIPQEIKQGVINQGGGVFNHNLYFSILSPNAKKAPQGELLENINKTFGNLDDLKIKINNASISQFGSGYGFLVKDKDNNLSVINELNQNTPISRGLVPILCIDVWEHAYYLKYQNLRADYVKNIWNVIDWAKVEELYYNTSI